MENRKLRVWWIPQVPCKSFYVEVATVEEGVKIMDILGFYDVFQFENNIKPDYANAGGLEVFEDNEWTGWWIEDVNFGYYDNPYEYLESLNGLA